MNEQNFNEVRDIIEKKVLLLINEINVKRIWRLNLNGGEKIINL